MLPLKELNNLPLEDTFKAIARWTKTRAAFQGDQTGPKLGNAFRLQKAKAQDVRKLTDRMLTKNVQHPVLYAMTLWDTTIKQNQQQTTWFYQQQWNELSI